MSQTARFFLCFLVFLGLQVVFLRPAFAVRKGVVIDTAAEDLAWKYTAKIEILNSLNFVIKRCSGTLIDSRVLLTSAHCFSKESKSVLVGFGLNAESSFQSHTLSFSVHPDFKDIPTLIDQENGIHQGGASVDLNLLGIAPENKEFPVNIEYYLSELEKLLTYGIHNWLIEDLGVPTIPHNDLALIFLNEDVPEPFKAVPFARNFTPGYGQILRASGFGLHGISETALDDQLRTTKDLKITGVVVDGNYVTHITAFSFGDSNVCIGDSGGPAVIETDQGHALVGVLSALTNFCYGFSYFAAPSFHVSWINAEAFKYLGRFLEF